MNNNNNNNRNNHKRNNTSKLRIKITAIIKMLVNNNNLMINK